MIFSVGCFEKCLVTLDNRIFMYKKIGPERNSKRLGIFRDGKNLSILLCNFASYFVSECDLDFFLKLKHGGALTCKNIVHRIHSAAQYTAEKSEKMTKGVKIKVQTLTYLTTRNTGKLHLANGFETPCDRPSALANI